MSTSRSHADEPVTKKPSTSGPRLTSRHKFSARGSWRASVHGGLRFASPFKLEAASGAAKKRSG